MHGRGERGDGTNVGGGKDGEVERVADEDGEPVEQHAESDKDETEPRRVRLEGSWKTYKEKVSAERAGNGNTRRVDSPL